MRGKHRDLIARIVQEGIGAKTRGFQGEVHRISDFCRWGEGSPVEIGMAPDAFVIDEERQLVLVFEVIVTSGLTTEKLDKLVRLLWALDEDYWALGVVAVDCHGVGKLVDVNVTSRNADDLRAAVYPTFNLYLEGDLRAWAASLEMAA
jgi:hypothetical protein